MSNYYLLRAAAGAAALSCRLGNDAMPKNVDILEASDEIGGAGGLGSISGVKRTEKTLFCEKVCFPGEFGLRSRYIVCLSLE
ncbi:hypothetical protein [Paenibacillus albidus]|nr:hypothetical protein [Paenibacillus albidus]